MPLSDVPDWLYHCVQAFHWLRHRSESSRKLRTPIECHKSALPFTSTRGLVLDVSICGASWNGGQATDRRQGAPPPPPLLLPQ